MEGLTRLMQTVTHWSTVVPTTVAGQKTKARSL